MMFEHSYTDFDAFAADAQRWDLRLKQLDAGQFQAGLLQFVAEGVQVSEARFGRTIRQQGNPPQGLRTVVIPAVANFDFEWRGAKIDGDSMMIFPEGGELDALSRSKFHIFTCSFPESLLANVASSLGIANLGEGNS